MTGYLADTSFLRVFTSVQRLDLVDCFQPLYITPNIVDEHGKAPQHAIEHLEEWIDSDKIHVSIPSSKLHASDYSAKDPRLSTVDWEIVLHAQAKGLVVFVADGLFREECGRRGVQTSGVSSLLLYHRQQGKLDGEAVKTLAESIEGQGFYKFNSEERGGLGL